MTNTNELADGIIKKDTRGRMRATPERRGALLEEFDRSAMTGRKFAQWAGIKYSTFTNWLKVRRQTTGAGQKESVKTEGTRWLEAVVTAPRPGTSSSPNVAVLVVQGPGGLRLELSSAEQVPLAARLLRELGWKPGC